MDINEKQQTAESIKALIKARWFFAATVFVQGLIISLFFSSVPLAPKWQLSLLLIASYLYNFIYWLYVKQPPEKMTEFGIKLVKACQVPLDFLAISTLLYLSGTIDKQIVVWYFVVLMSGISLHRKKGIILTAILCSFLYSGLAILEYYGLMTTSPGTTDFISIYGNFWFLMRRLIGFNSYVIAAAFFVWFLGDLFRRRERRLVDQKNDLVKKTNLLMIQTKELTQAKGQVEGALTRSDIARRAATQSIDEAEKSNLELKKKIDELEKFYKITVGREVRMVELKSQIKDLKDTIKKLEEELSGR